MDTRVAHEKWEVVTARLRRVDEKQAKRIPKTLIKKKINLFLKIYQEFNLKSNVLVKCLPLTTIYNNLLKEPAHGHTELG